MADLLEILITLLPEFDLPEPETKYTLKDGKRQIELLMAFRDEKIGIRRGGSLETMAVSDWTVWECETEERARVVCAAIAKAMGIEPSVLRLDFSRVASLLDAQQFDSAREELDVIQGKIQMGHPDWDKCEDYRKKIRKALKSAKRTEEAAETPIMPQISFVNLLKADARRISISDIPDFNILGLFSPQDESLSAVDAVWVAQVIGGKATVWAACLEGNPAYAQDPSWETVGSEVELLQTLLVKLGNTATFIWEASGYLLLLQRWHRRAVGSPLPPGLNFIDLQAICRVSFPMAHRTDLAESLCKQLNIPFTDAMGNGGPLAAMTFLLQKCSATLKVLPDEQREALRTILSFKLPDRYDGDLLGIEEGVPLYAAIPPSWLDFFLPPGKAAGFQGYLDLLIRHYRRLAPPVQTSMGDRKTHTLDVMDFFKKGGLLAQAASFDYRERADQIGFSLKIEEALADELPYLLEAGTGIGKTVGYLVPVLLGNQRAFVSTHTKPLQDQAWSKDVPLVLKAFSLAGIERSVSIIKGKGNYVCLQTVGDWLDEPGEILRSAEDQFFLAALLNWLLITNTGWLSEIEHLGSWRLRSLLGRDQAPPKLQDAWVDIDPHAKAREAAGKADLVLTNHSYVFSVANAADTSKHDVDVLILDEAHNIDEVVTEVLTLHFRPWALMHEMDSVLKRDDKGKVQGLYRALLHHPQINDYEELKKFRDRMENAEKHLHAWCHSARVRLGDMLCDVRDFDPDLPLPFPLDQFWIASLYDAAKSLHDQLSALANAIHQLLEQLPNIRGLKKRIAGSLLALEEHLNENAEALNDLFETRDDAVHWGEARVRVDAHGRLTEEDGITAWKADLHSTPLDIAGWLKSTVNVLYKYRIYVSATLSVGGEFKSIIERFGLEAVQDKLLPVTGIYPSPFDFRKQALLAVPHDMRLPDPNLRIDPLYVEQQSNHIAELASVSDGRMMVLFTSNLMMREMLPRLQSRLQSKGILVLSQTDAGRSALIDRLREAPRKGEKMVLLGLRAFWEGVDIAGEALSVLVVSKLPFDYHGHPVYQAKKRFYESQGFDRDYFRERVVPNVFLHLRQMYGRLIRSESDRGATVITDPRVYTKQYGKHLLKRLPETTTVIDKSPVVVDAVRRFLNGEDVESSYVWGELPITILGLSPEQKHIVESPSKRILVRAAAGSGKTHVLTSRIVRVVEAALAKPEDILALTFTNKAMNVMYDRLEQTLGGDKAYPMHRNVLTYHKLAMRIIRQDDLQQGAETEFIDEKNPEIQETLFQQARAEAGLTEESLTSEDARTLIAYAQNGLVNEAELAGKIPEWEKSDITLAKFAKFFLAYVRVLRECNLIDYGEAIVRAVRILRDQEQAKRWNNRFKWVFCDEYQDTSPAQATLLQLLAQQANLFVVGDNAQSIYSWQGSDPDNLRRFELDFPNTATFNLSKNYRCFPKLVRMSARFLDRCGHNYGIRMEYDQKRSTEDQNVYYLHNESDRTEAEAIAKLAKEGLELEIPGDPPPAATVGILARKWNLLDTLERELIKQGIPYKFEGETARGITAGGGIKQIITRAVDLCRQSKNEQEYGDTREGKIIQKLRNGEISKAPGLLQAVRASMPGEDLTKVEAYEFYRLTQILEEQPLDNLVRLFDTTEKSSKVVLSTVHSQKGEEFDTVIVIGLEEGNSPHEHPKSHQGLIEWRKVVQALSHATWRSALTDLDLQRLYDEEERRIFYVAMTRAKHNLIVSRANSRYLFGKQKSYDKSAFLALAHDPKLVCEISNAFDVSLTTPTKYTQDEGYRSDGRVYQTDCGILVRSKSEMLLANEFMKRGIFFDYEEPQEGIADALPDFIFPDYGQVILEHLGLLEDPTYLERWEKKAQEYEKNGIRYFRTGENEIKNLPATVDRLHEQMMTWTESQCGAGRVAGIEIIERLRRDSDLRIGKAIGSFEQGVFEVMETSDNPVIAISVRSESGGAVPFTFNPPPLEEVKLPGVDDMVWAEKDLTNVRVALFRSKVK